MVILAIIVQLGALFRSRNDFLAFSIANVLSTLQIILFFQRKTLRKCYQILTISFIEVAVGCVFQRSGLFVSALPIYAILAFTCFSLLFMWGERKFYAERVVLKNRFVSNKNLEMITAEENTNPSHTSPDDLIDNSVAYKYGSNANAIDETRFFRRQSVQPILFEFEFFRRFIVGALGACFFASMFFCLFPRMDQVGYGAIQFDSVSWQSIRGGKTTKTGFKPSIELGDLGPSVDSHAVVMTIKFQDALSPDKLNPIEPIFPVYLRGIALANYRDNVWADVKTVAAHYTSSELIEAIRLKTIVDPLTIVTKEIISGDQIIEQHDLTPKFPKFSPHGRNSQFQHSPPFNVSPTVRNYTNDLLTRSTFFQQPPTLLPYVLTEEPNLSDKELESRLTNYCILNKNNLLYDIRSQLINMKIKLNRLDTPIVFSTYPFFVVKSTSPIGSNRSLGIQLSTSDKENLTTNEFWFLTTCFQNGRQIELTPNQERVYPYIDQYLALDPNDFPLLIKTAQKWDTDSNLPQDDFIARAKNIESKLRDEGVYKYNRLGVLRNPEIAPLEDFISEHKEGHCEYFAGALTLLLRAIGIPARVVVGYACYPSKDESTTIVRQSDAHSWVEAYIPYEKLPTSKSPYSHLFAGSLLQDSNQSYLPQETKEWIKDGAWLRLDATPATERDAERPNLLTVGFYNWSHFFKTFGDDFIMNFNGARQMKSVYQPLKNIWTSLINNLTEIQNNFHGIEFSVRKCFNVLNQIVRGEWTPETIINFFLILASIVVVLYFLYRFFKKLCIKLKDKVVHERESRRRQRLLLKNCDEIANKIYRQVEKYLEIRVKTVRKRNETPIEFIERCFLLEDHIQENNLSCSSNDQKSLSIPEIKTSENIQKDVDNRLSQEQRNAIKSLVRRYYQSQFGGLHITSLEAQLWNEQLKFIQYH